MKSFLDMNCSSIEAFLIEHQTELGMEGLEAGDVSSQVAAGRAAIEAREYGFAIVQLKDAGEGKLMPHLWVIYIAESQRGRRLGRRFMRAILRKYSRDFHMTLGCFGTRRRKFFGGLGFRIESKEGEYRRMTTNDYR
jgi:GNAT superfamily N-acetyltransferase